MKRPQEFLILLLISLLGLTLRWVDLSRESIWLDEAFSLDMASHQPAEIIRGQPLDPGNPPGYYVLLHAWLQQFGPSVESGRAFSGLFGALGIPAVWLLARAAGQGAHIGLLAALLVAISPPLVYLSREVRVYTLFTLMLTLAAAAAEGIIHRCPKSKTPQAVLWIGFTLAASTLSYLHYYSFLILAVFGLYLFVRLIGRGIAPIAYLFLSYILIVAAFLPWLPMFKQQIAMGTTRAGATWLQHLVVLPLYSLAGTTLVWKEDGTLAVAAMTAVSIFFVYLPALYWSWKGKTLSAISLVLPLGLIGVAVFISVAKSPMLQSRYLAPIFPCLMLFLASGLIASRSIAPRPGRLVAAITAALMLSSLAFLYRGGYKEDWRPVADFIARSESSIPAYCYEDVAALSLRYYAPNLDIHSIDPVRLHFSPNAQSWNKEGLITKWESHKDGFWMILYLSLGETMPELSAIDSWLREHFQVVSEFGEKVDNPKFPFIRLYRLQPKSPR